MKKVFKTLTLLAISTTALPRGTEHIISFFMRPFPHIAIEKEVTQDYADRKSKKLRNPEKIAKYTLRSILQSSDASGIFSTYKGQLTLSDTNGQVTFIRRQEEPNMQLLITPRIDPILKQQQVIDHWQLELGAPAELYSVALMEDPDTETSFWNVEKIKPGAEKHINLNTVIIFAKPSHIFVPEGITILERDPNLILPDLYVKKNIDKLSTSLYVLNLKRFFRENKTMQKLQEKDLMRIVY